MSDLDLIRDGRYPAKKRRFTRGIRIPALQHLVVEVKSGNWVYMRETPKHPKVLMNMTLRTLNDFVEGGSLYYAIDRQSDG